MEGSLEDAFFYHQNNEKREEMDVSKLIINQQQKRQTSRCGPTMNTNGLTSAALNILPADIPNVDLGVRLCAATHESAVRVPRGGNVP